MTRANPRHSRPVLYLLVFGAFLLIVGLTATGQSLLVTADSSTSLVNGSVGADAATVRSFVMINLHPEDIAGSRLAPERKRYFDDSLALLRAEGGIQHAALLLPDGTALASDSGEAVSSSVTARPGFQAALHDGAVQASLITPETDGPAGPLPSGGAIEEYFPIISGGQVFAIVAIWRDAGPILSQLEAVRVHIVAVVLGAALVSLALLYFVFRAAQHRLSRQTTELLEATRRDALTGSLNHGALVEALTERIQSLRNGDEFGVGVALLDIDNLTLLNNTYGHSAGDDALLALADLIDAHVPDGGVWGRYGPDEFLVIAGGTVGALIEPAIDRIRTALADLALTYETSERLPITLSGGIAHYPVDGQSVTSLLAAASVTLDEAKASGGDAVRIAEAVKTDEATGGRFDVLDSLVLAIDTKDRYTRRHSEDVARYASFLAARLDLYDDFRHSLYRAGRLHDIGKIGIPDGILRKPGKLTDDEYAIVKQHVALGDLIVRDLHDEELVRAGVRHHHERWDGKGYLTGLAGEDIPLIARLLAIADAFSAMTTTRPYRKALSVDEALRRLEDASATQLDARLVVAFVEGIRTDANPPLPGDGVSPRLWTPQRIVA